MKNKLLKYPIIEAIFAVIWLLSFNNFFKVVSFWIGTIIGYFLNYFWYAVLHLKTISLVKIFDIVPFVITYVLYIAIKITILVLGIILIRKLKFKYGK